MHNYKYRRGQWLSKYEHVNYSKRRCQLTQTFTDEWRADAWQVRVDVCGRTGVHCQRPVSRRVGLHTEVSCFVS